MAEKKRKASGRNIREDERHTVAVKLRLPPDMAEDLNDLAARWSLTRSDAVARLIEEARASLTAFPQKESEVNRFLRRATVSSEYRSRRAF